VSTHRVPGLLSKDLGQPDHLCIVVETFSEIDHIIRLVLLVTRARCNKERVKGVDGLWVAFFSTASGVLRIYRISQMRPFYHDYLKIRFTQAFSHNAVD
jgi:hypothetical protein